MQKNSFSSFDLPLIFTARIKTSIFSTLGLIGISGLVGIATAGFSSSVYAQSSQNGPNEQSIQNMGSADKTVQMEKTEKSAKPVIKINPAPLNEDKIKIVPKNSTEEKEALAKLVEDKDNAKVDTIYKVDNVGKADKNVKSSQGSKNTKDNKDIKGNRDARDIKQEAQQKEINEANKDAKDLQKDLQAENRENKENKVPDTNAATDKPTPEKASNSVNATKDTKKGTATTANEESNSSFMSKRNPNSLQSPQITAPLALPGQPGGITTALPPPIPPGMQLPSGRPLGLPGMQGSAPVLSPIVPQSLPGQAVNPQQAGGGFNNTPNNVGQNRVLQAQQEAAMANRIAPIYQEERAGARAVIEKMASNKGACVAMSKQAQKVWDIYDKKPIYQNKTNFMSIVQQAKTKGCLKSTSSD